MGCATNPPGCNALLLQDPYLLLRLRQVHQAAWGEPSNKGTVILDAPSLDVHLECAVTYAHKSHLDFSADYSKLPLDQKL